MSLSKLSTIKRIVLDNTENMLILAFLLVGNQEMANVIVELVLVELWEQEQLLEDEKAMHQFLYSRVKQECELKNLFADLLITI